MARVHLLGTSVALAVLAAPLSGQTRSPGRVSDKQVEAAIKQVNDGLDRFVDKMDPQMRTAVLRSERGQVDMKAFLGDLRKAGDAMKSRFDPPRYSANSEVLAFLTQARRLEDGIARRPGVSGADPTWEILSPGLVALGSAYGIEWRAEPGSWKAARLSDPELKATLGALEKKTESLRKALEKDLKKDKSLDATARANALAPALDLSATAKQASSAFAQGADVSPLVGRLGGSAAALETFMTARKPAAAVLPLWSGVQGELGKVAKAYGVAARN